MGLYVQTSWFEGMYEITDLTNPTNSTNLFSDLN